MARTRYYAAASLDGFIADADHNIEWLTGFEGTYAGSEEPVEDAMNAFMEEIGSLVMGSATYDFLLNEVSAWPYEDKPTWVLTSRKLERIDGADLRFHDGPIAEIHSELLAAAGGRDVWVVGGGPVASQMADEGLLDELIVTVVPVVLGEGKGLFEGPLAEPMHLRGERASSNGMVELTYELGKSG